MRRAALTVALVALALPTSALARVSERSARHIIMTSNVWAHPRPEERVWWRGCVPYDKGRGQRCNVDDRMIWCVGCIDEVTLRLTFDVFGPRSWFEVDVSNVAKR